MMDSKERTDALVAQNAALALSLNWMRRQAEAKFDEGNLPSSFMGEDVLRDRQQDKIEEQAREIATLVERRERRDAAFYDTLEETQAYAADLERRHLEMLGSTSWRLTAPLRWVVRRLRGHPAPQFAPRYPLDTAPGDP